MIADKYTYLLVDMGCLLVPLLASFHPKTNFYKHWKHFLASCTTVAAFFIIWDALFTELGVWGFNPRYLTGIYLYNLPIEEILFFIAIPYACVFTYFCVRKFIELPPKFSLSKTAQYLFATSALIFGLWNYQRYYTSTTFILLSILLFVLHRKQGYVAYFFISFLIILLPFFISNGILTGSFIDEPVVIYNNTHNLGIRMGTIPVEDMFYAMLMLLMNVAGFEYLLGRKHMTEIPFHC